MDPRLQFEKPIYDEATWRSAVVTAKRDNLSLDSLSSLNIHHQDLIPQLVLLGLSIWVSPMLKSKSVATDRRRAKWNCIHLFLLFRFFGILGSFENSNACPKIWTLFVQTLILLMRLHELQLSHRPLVNWDKIARPALTTTACYLLMPKERSKRGRSWSP